MADTQTERSIASKEAAVLPTPPSKVVEVMHETESDAREQLDNKTQVIFREGDVVQAKKRIQHAHNLAMGLLTGEYIRPDTQEQVDAAEYLKEQYNQATEQQPTRAQSPDTVPYVANVSAKRYVPVRTTETVINKETGEEVTEEVVVFKDKSLGELDKETRPTYIEDRRDGKPFAVNAALFSATQSALISPGEDPESRLRVQAVPTLRPDGSIAGFFGFIGVEPHLSTPYEMLGEGINVPEGQTVPFPHPTTTQTSR